MCGRYILYTEKEAMEINEIIKEVERKMGKENKVKTGEIFPTNLAPVLIDNPQGISPTLMTWGFPNYNNKGVIINAKSETANEKPTFRDAVMTRRCVVPSSGFFEWASSSNKKQKDKYLFEMPKSKVLYMAGLYSNYKVDGNVTTRFVILTTQANESVVDIHNRMPLILSKEKIFEWIKDSSATEYILHMQSPALIKTLV